MDEVDRAVALYIEIHRLPSEYGAPLHGHLNSMVENLAKEGKHGEFETKLAEALGANPPGSLTSESAAQAIKATISPFLHQASTKCDWRSNDYDSLKAYFMACLSELAYLPNAGRELDDEGRYKLVPSELLQEVARLGLRLSAQDAFPVDGVEAIEIEREFSVSTVLNFPKFTVVAVRGTAALYEWLLINLDALPVQWKAHAAAGKLHVGWSEEARQALPQIAPHISLERPVYFTGHSLGAALAAILTLFWMERHSNATTPYLFASPRYGSKEIVSRVSPFAFVKSTDIVPHIPMKVFGYADASPSEIVIGRSTVKKSLRSALKYWTTPTAGKPFAVHHDMCRYREIIGNMVGQQFPALAYLDAIRQAMK